MIKADATIAVHMECTECGHLWDIEDYDNMSTHAAEEKAKHDETCPNGCDMDE